MSIIDLNEDDPGSWPFSDSVYIITTAPLRETENWVAELSPDEVSIVDHEGLPQPFPALQPGCQLYCVWWD